MFTDNFHCGVFTADITPMEPTFLYGYPKVERISTGVNDPLYASVLCLKSGQTGVLLIALDLLFVTPSFTASVRKRIAEATGIDYSSILITCTHTHSAPVTANILAFEHDPIVPPPDKVYMEMLADKIVAAAKNAAENLQECEIACTEVAVEGLGGNRHSQSGLSDKMVSMIVVRELATKNILAVSMTCAMHPTVLHEDSFLVSGDFPAYARMYLQEKLGGGVEILYHSGAAGDQSPRYAVKSQTFSEAERLGHILGEKVHEHILSLSDDDYKSVIPIKVSSLEVTLPRRVFPSVVECEGQLTSTKNRYDQLQAGGVRGPELRTAECAVFGAEEAVFLAKQSASGRIAQFLDEEYNKAEIQVVFLGNSAIVGIPGEIFVEYGLTIKARSSVPCCVMTLCNGDLQGYIVTEEARANGAYEAGFSVYDPSAGNVIVNAALSLLN